EYGVAQGDLSESTDAAPTTLYGRSKLAGTRALTDRCRALGLNGLTARLFTVYGPEEQPGRLLPTLCTAAATQEPIELSDGRQRRDFTYIEDVVEGLLRLGVAAPNPGSVVNMATGRLTSVRSFVQTTAE